MVMDYYYLMRVPLVHLLQIEGDDTQAPQDRLKAREALYARTGELNGGGWGNLGTAARAAMVRFFDREVDDEAKADVAIEAAKKADRRVT